MIWGAPGIGKSSIVEQLAKENSLEFVDLRLSQLAPTDLRGLPVAIDGLSKWYPPDFLPRAGEGILFLDEINMAVPTMQGMAQQLILDRKIGSYEVPEGWFIWAAGNRKEDRASVFDMPTPLSNRFLHLQVEPDIESFKAFAIAKGVNEQIIAFLSFRPNLLHKVDAHQPAWCSPRSWIMASALHSAGLSITPAVGEGAGAEFSAYTQVYKDLPDLEKILAGNGGAETLSEEISIRYATVVGLAVRVSEAKECCEAMDWLVKQNAGADWIQLFAIDAFPIIRKKDQFALMWTMTGEKYQDLRENMRSWNEFTA